MIEGERCRLRPYRRSDVESIVELANDAAVARWLSRRFPLPYQREHALAWIEAVGGVVPRNDFAIEVEGAYAGGVGLVPLADERAGVALLGYWLGRRHWGRGIASEAARLMAAHAFAERGLRRLEATVFAPNLASARVLEKTGFVREAVMRAAYAERDGTVVDGLLYAKLRADVADQEPAGS